MNKQVFQLLCNDWQLVHWCNSLVRCVSCGWSCAFQPQHLAAFMRIVFEMRQIKRLSGFPRAAPTSQEGQRQRFRSRERTWLESFSKCNIYYEIHCETSIGWSSPLLGDLLGDYIGGLYGTGLLNLREFPLLGQDAQYAARGPWETRRSYRSNHAQFVLLRAQIGLCGVNLTFELYFLLAIVSLHYWLQVLS